MTDKTVAVIGGGPAGMIAAGRLKDRVEKVILIEKNPMLGKKLRITGKGRCNITNIADIEDIMANIPTNSRFLYSALYSFTNDDVIELMHSLGVKTKVERGGRVFPESDSARDVAEALKRYALGKNVTLVKENATGIIVKDGKVKGVKCGDKEIPADSVIVATGGVSYPLTGSTGDGYRFAEKTGHTVIPPKPSLVPLETKEKWVSEVMGLALKNVELTLWSGEKKIYTDFGEMLFTHFGLSGPLILSASSHMRDIENDDYKIYIDLKPALDEKKLDARILRDFEEELNRDLINGLDKLLPKALIPIVIENSGLDGRKKINSVTKAERQSLVNTIKGLCVNPTSFRPVKEAIITSGGVKVSEINPSTMESKLINGLYFAGEIIDVDAYTGGYNLQIAWSTGYLAGVNASDTL